jgi:uncharacterized protein YecT (DUF1311 family)
MKIRYLYLNGLLVLLAALVGSAAKCAGKKPLITNHQLVERALDEFSAADTKMNAAYQQLLAILDDDGKAALKEAQRKWIEWRDAEAQLDAHELKGGKLFQMEVNGSLAETTKKRTDQLVEYYKRFKTP